MISQLSIPTGVILTSDLRTLKDYLETFYSFRPDGSMPFFEEDKDREAYREKVAEYKFKLLEFNSKLTALIDEAKTEQQETVSRIKKNQKSQRELTDKVALLIKTELDLLASVSGIEDTELYPSWRQSTEQNLWRLYGYGM